MHLDLKRMSGYSNVEIYQKPCVLDKVMLTKHPSTHIQQLQNAGCKHYTLCFQCFNFSSLVNLNQIFLVMDFHNVLIISL